MRSIHRLAVLSTLAVAACSSPGPKGNGSIKPGQFPRYNEVFRKATHNSFWLDVASPSSDYGASGTQERLVDQLLFEHTRAFELDVHPDPTQPGQFRVFHTADGDLNSSCRTLADCLQAVQRLGYLVPEHEVFNVVLELKEIFAHTFDATHQPADLDRQLRASLGKSLYAPSDFLARCPGAATLRACLDAAGWPTTDQLRGRVIVNVIGNWGDNYVDWIDYASGDGGIAGRAAFPLRSMLNTTLGRVGERTAAAIAGAPNDPYIEVSGGSEQQVAKPTADDIVRLAGSGQLLAARAASIFWQVEDLDFLPADGAAQPPERWDQFRDGGGMARSKDAHDPYQPDDVAQKDVIETYGFQMIQTDFPWHFISDDPALRPDGAAVPTLAARAFFEPCDALGGRAQKGQPGCTLDEAVLTEPGHRLLLSDGAALRKAAAGDGSHVWETQPSATTVTHDDKLPPWGTPGARGCLTARSSDGAAHLELCRFGDGDRGRSVHVSVAAVGVAGGPVSHDYVVPAQHAEPGDVGDLLRMRVTVDASGTTVSLSTAGLIGADGAPQWSPLPSGDLLFPGVALTSQGLSSTGQTLFVATRRDDAAVGAGDFDGGVNGALVDQSH